MEAWRHAIRNDRVSVVSTRAKHQAGGSVQKGQGVRAEEGQTFVRARTRSRAVGLCPVGFA